MSGQPESFVKLAPVNVNIAEGDNLIFDYALQEFSSNTPLVIGIASPHIAAATDTLRREIESGLLRGLAVKRPHDVWCIRRYSTSEGREGGGAPAKADAAADAPSRLLVDPKAIETAIQTMGSSADAARDFTSAVSNLIDDVRTARGDRHVVALAASPPPPGSGAELAATARKRGVVVHCVGPRCGELTELTCGSGGVFVSSDHPSAVEVLCLRLISRYEVTYRFASQNGSDVTLQITTPTAAGDASTSTSNHPFPIAS
jgi:hypothetical protein